MIMLIKVEKEKKIYTDDLLIFKGDTERVVHKNPIPDLSVYPVPTISLDPLVPNEIVIDHQ